VDLAQGADVMSTKPTGLAAFTRKSITAVPVVATVETSASSGAERQRGKKEVVALTVRLQRAEWERLHQLAVSEGTSIQSLAVRGLSRMFSEKGLPPLRES
jgi:hypothetical protein